MIELYNENTKAYGREGAEALSHFRRMGVDEESIRDNRVAQEK